MQKTGFAVLLLTFLLYAGNSIAQMPVDYDYMPVWLPGLWEHKTARGSIFEEWTRTDRDNFHGRSYMLKGRDTVILETIQLKDDKNKVQYIPTVSGQNQTKPVVFNATKLGRLEMIFENPEHDFPQRIRYTWINHDSMLAVISGKKNGKESKREFPMKRVK